MTNKGFSHVSNCFFRFLAPEEVEVILTSENTLVINITADEETPGDSYFIAEVKAKDGASCRAEASVEPIECELEDLADATKYTVGVRACLVLSRKESCSQEVTAEGYTLPNRENLISF